MPQSLPDRRLLLNVPPILNSLFLPTSVSLEVGLPDQALTPMRFRATFPRRACDPTSTSQNPPSAAKASRLKSTSSAEYQVICDFSAISGNAGVSTSLEVSGYDWDGGGGMRASWHRHRPLAVEVACRVFMEIWTMEAGETSIGENEGNCLWPSRVMTHSEYRASDLMS